MHSYSNLNYCRFENISILNIVQTLQFGMQDMLHIIWSKILDLHSGSKVFNQKIFFTTFQKIRNFNFEKLYIS